MAILRDMGITTMTTMTATEVKKRFGELGDQVRSGPIRVTKSGRDAMVIVSADEYDRLTEMEDRLWGERALEVVRSGKPLGLEATAQWIQNLVEKAR
jgi:antitoxin Phd